MLPHEIEACLGGALSAEAERVYAGYYTDGGFHANVSPALRHDFVYWFEHKYVMPELRNAPSPIFQVSNETQLDLFANTAHI